MLFLLVVFLPYHKKKNQKNTFPHSPLTPTNLSSCSLSSCFLFLVAYLVALVVDDDDVVGGGGEVVFFFAVLLVALVVLVLVVVALVLVVLLATVIFFVTFLVLEASRVNVKA